MSNPFVVWRSFGAERTAGNDAHRHHAGRAAGPAAAVAVAAALVACGESDAYAPTVARLDSAGIEIVTSSAGDIPMPWSFTREFALGGADEGVESFYRLLPSLLATDADGRIHVLDYASHRVVSFARDGTFLRELGREGGGPGELQQAYVLSATSDGAVAVFDYGKVSLVRWGADGELLPQQRFPHPPSGGGRHHALTPEGYLVSTGGSIEGERVNRLLAVTGEDTTLLAWAVQPDRGMIEFPSCGGAINFPPLFTPTVVWDHRDGTTVVAPSDEYRIDVWRHGSLVRSIRRPVPVTRATRELAMAEAGDGFTINFGRGPCTVTPGEYADARGWAETVPAIADLRIAADGSLWVRRRVPGQENPPIDLFSPSGAYRGTLPAGTPFPALLLPDGGVGVITRDELDVDRLVVWGAAPAADAAG